MAMIFVIIGKEALVSFEEIGPVMPFRIRMKFNSNCIYLLSVSVKVDIMLDSHIPSHGILIIA